MTSEMNHLSREELYSDINQLKRKINYLTTDLNKFKVISKEFQKYFEFFNEMNEKITSNKQILDLIKRLKVLKYFNEESCFVSVIPLDKNHFKRTKLISKTKVENSLNKLNANNVSSNETFNPQILKNEIQSEDIEEEVQNESEFKIENIKSLKTRPLPVSSESEDNGSTFDVIEDPKSDTSDEEWNEFENKSRIGSKQMANEKSVDSKPRVLKCNSKENRRVFECEVEGCEYRGTAQFLLDRHTKRMHYNLRKYNCSVDGCDKRFGIHSDLTQHMKCVHKIVKTNENQTRILNLKSLRTNTKRKYNSIKSESEDDYSESNDNLLNAEEVSDYESEGIDCDIIQSNGETNGESIDENTEQNNDIKEEIIDSNESEIRVENIKGLIVIKGLRTNTKPQQNSISGESEDNGFECSDYSDNDIDYNPNEEQFDSKKTIRPQNEEVFECKVEGCVYRGRAQLLLARHMSRMHTNYGKFKCSVDGCNKCFSLDSYLAQHMKRFHKTCDSSQYSEELLNGKSSNGMFICDHIGCGKEFTQNHLLKRHKQMHSGKASQPKVEYKCDFEGCSASFSLARTLQVHKGKHFAKFSCDFEGCLFKAGSKYHMSRHKMSKHSDQRPFICCHKSCGKNFKTKEKCTEHQKLTHKTEDHCCKQKECGFRVDPNYDPNYNLIVNPTVKRYYCEWEGCTSSFGTNKDRNRHMNRHKGTYSCECCPFKGDSEIDVMRHKLISHSEEVSFKCPVNGCNEEFKTEENLREHQSSEHPIEFVAMPWIQCIRNDCEYKSKSKDYMFRHRAQHMIHTCDVCQKQFISISKLNAHKSVHSGVGAKRFACDWPGCERVFKRTETLKDHMNIHTGAITYRCDWPGCEKTFVYRTSLSVHLYRHRGRKYFECEVCKFRSGTPLQYKNHMKTHETQSKGPDN